MANSSLNTVSRQLLRPHMSSCRRRGGLSRTGGESGFILVIAMFALVLLSLMGAAASRNSAIELQIAGNDKIYLTNLYKADAAAYEAATRIKQESATNLSLHKLDVSDIDPSASGIISKQELSSTAKITDYDPTDNDGVQTLFSTDDLSVTSVNGGKFLAVDRGLLTGSSLNMTTSSQVHGYDVYGYSSQKNSGTIIRLGLRRRF